MYTTTTQTIRLADILLGGVGDTRPATVGELRRRAPSDEDMLLIEHLDDSTPVMWLTSGEVPADLTARLFRRPHLEWYPRLGTVRETAHVGVLLDGRGDLDMRDGALQVVWARRDDQSLRDDCIFA